MNDIDFLRHTTHDTVFCKDCLDFYRGKHSVPVAGLSRLSMSVSPDGVPL